MGKILRGILHGAQAVLKAGAVTVLAFPHLAPPWVAPAAYLIGHLIGVNIPTP